MELVSYTYFPFLGHLRWEVLSPWATVIGSKCGHVIQVWPIPALPIQRWKTAPHFLIINLTLSMAMSGPHRVAALRTWRWHTQWRQDTKRGKVSRLCVHLLLRPALALLLLWFNSWQRGSLSPTTTRVWWLWNLDSGACKSKAYLCSFHSLEGRKGEGTETGKKYFLLNLSIIRSELPWVSKEMA